MLATTNGNYTAKDNRFARLLDDSLEIAGVRGRYGGILVVPPPKYPHIPSLPQEIPKKTSLTRWYYDGNYLMIMMKNRTRFFSVLLILLAAGLWASSGIFVNGVVTHSDISPLNLAFLRELLTFLVLFGIVRVWKHKTLQVEKKDWIWLALMGGIGIGLFHAIWNYSVIINGMSVATMLQYNEAVIISIAAVFFFKEPMHWRKVVAIIGSLIGTALISLGMGFDVAQIARIGLLIGVGSAVAHSTFSLFGKKLSGSYPASTIIVYAFGFATLVLLPFQFIDPAPTYVSTKAIGHLLILVLGPTLVAFAAYTTALKWLPVSTAAVIATSEVPMAALFGTIFLGETLGRWQVIGAALVVLGVILVSIEGKRRLTEAKI